MGKKNKTESEENLQQVQPQKRPLTAKEKRRLIMAALFTISMFVMGYYVIKQLIISYDSKLGGTWQLKTVALEANNESKAQVGLRLAVHDEKNGPEASYEVIDASGEVLTDTGYRTVPELGEYIVVLQVKGLTPWEMTKEQLSHGAIDIPSEQNHDGILNNMEAFFLDDGDITFCYGFNKPVEVTNFESTKRHVDITFEIKE